MDKQTAVEDLSASLIGATWTTAVLLEYLEGGVAIAGGAAIIWYNVEKRWPFANNAGRRILATARFSPQGCQTCFIQRRGRL